MRKTAFHQFQVNVVVDPGYLVRIDQVQGNCDGTFVYTEQSRTVSSSKDGVETIVSGIER